MNSNSEMPGHAIKFIKSYIMPIVALASFFPVYFWSFTYPLPSEVRLLLDGGVFSFIVLELVAACAACALIARFTVYQLTPLFRRVFLQRNRELRWGFMEALRQLVLKLSIVFNDELKVTMSIFVIVITFYFFGFVALLFLGLYFFLCPPPSVRARRHGAWKLGILMQSDYRIGQQHGSLHLACLPV